MTVFVDTSALFALRSSGDERHADAARIFASLREQDEDLLTSNYVLIESYALIGRRLGIASARALRDQVIPILRLHWVGSEAHREAEGNWLSSGMRRSSLIDWVSFGVMRREGIEEAFAFDPDFASQGFRLMV